MRFRRPRIVPLFFLTPRDAEAFELTIPHRPFLAVCGWVRRPDEREVEREADVFRPLIDPLHGRVVKTEPGELRRRECHFANVTDEPRRGAIPPFAPATGSAFIFGPIFVSAPS